MKRVNTNRIIAIAITGLFFGLYRHRDYVRWGTRGKDAFMQIDVDSPLSKAALSRICAIPDVDEAKYLDKIP